ncbi:TIGR01244 family sulfur transferase [Aestuariivita boseongensis]|uniref:TIGR01244 family sulfur transferase n=1 Tax=Aestuariivita boseongensis TaxID=1470562 RepID=UPI00068057CF|nr:TIGR01244 family sulfur transferase [Aestuariivita boseongensis]
MDIRQLTPRYSVSPQISAEDLAGIAAAGFTTVICNRPDEEVPPSHQAASIGAAAEAAGLSFKVLPITHQSMTPETVATQRDLVDGSDGPVLAYCASGTRCSVIWALDAAREMPVDDVLETARRAGYALDNLRPTLEAISQNG